MCQQFANPIFLTPVNKFPKRFNSLFELRILVQNYLKNLYFITIKLISKVTPERRKCCFRGPNFKNCTGVHVPAPPPQWLCGPCKPVIQYAGSAPVTGMDSGFKQKTKVVLPSKRYRER